MGGITLELTPQVINLDIIPETTIVEISAGIPRATLKLFDNIANYEIDGIEVSLTAAENLSFGDVCYLNGSEKWAKADASNEVTARAHVMAAESITTDNIGKFLLIGFARNDTWSWTVGSEIYLSESPGGLTQTAPTTSNSVTLVLGTAISTNRMYFKPYSNLIVHI